MSSHPIHVFSEIGKLKKVMLHRPGQELENLMPDHLERLLFDDIPFLADAQSEHDAFAQALRDEGIEVLYLEQLAAESLTSPEIRDQFIEEYLNEANIRGRQTKNAIRKLLHDIDDNLELIKKTMAGVQKVELPDIPEEGKGLTTWLNLTIHLPSIQCQTFTSPATHLRLSGMQYHLITCTPIHAIAKHFMVSTSSSITQFMVAK